MLAVVEEGAWRVGFTSLILLAVTMGSYEQGFKQMFTKFRVRGC